MIVTEPGSPPALRWAVRGVLIRTWLGWSNKPLFRKQGRDCLLLSIKKRFLRLRAILTNSLQIWGKGFLLRVAALARGSPGAALTAGCQTPASAGSFLMALFVSLTCQKCWKNSGGRGGDRRGGRAECSLKSSEQQ